MTKKTMHEIMDKMFTPDVRVWHNALGELMGIKALTPIAKDYVAGELYLVGMDIDSLQFPDMCVEYIDIDNQD